jgi:hypothetical protein
MQPLLLKDSTNHDSGYSNKRPGKDAVSALHILDPAWALADELGSSALIIFKIGLRISAS